jgi:hypothetical protein
MRGSNKAKPHAHFSASILGLAVGLLSTAALAQEGPKEPIDVGESEEEPRTGGDVRRGRRSRAGSLYANGIAGKKRCAAISFWTPFPPRSSTPGRYVFKALLETAGKRSEEYLRFSVESAEAGKAP